MGHRPALKPLLVRHIRLSGPNLGRRNHAHRRCTADLRLLGRKLQVELTCFPVSSALPTISHKLFPKKQEFFFLCSRERLYHNPQWPFARSFFWSTEEARAFERGAVDPFWTRGTAPTPLQERTTCKGRKLIKVKTQQRHQENGLVGSEEDSKRRPSQSKVEESWIGGVSPIVHDDSLTIVGASHSGLPSFEAYHSDQNKCLLFQGT
ncbi:hypothetical protein GW17_00004779 [Ensete ventricosum]|nr:hypothetical protein GW17_00004779 [Ensete ventricosum]